MSKFDITARLTGNRVGEVLVYGVLVDSKSFFDDEDSTITAKEFDRSIKELGKLDVLNIRVNSKGGSVWAGDAMADIIDSLRAAGTHVVAHIQGLGASMGFFFPQAADEVVMASNAMFMLHPPMGGVRGNYKDLLSGAEMLKKAQENLINLAMRRFRGTKEELVSLVEENGEIGTWLSAQEAFEYGLCDRIAEPVEFAACADGYRVNGIVVPTDALKGAADKIQIHETDGGEEEVIFDKETDVAIKALADAGKEIYINVVDGKAIVSEAVQSVAQGTGDFLTTEQIQEVTTLDDASGEIVLGALKDVVAAGIDIKAVAAGLDELKKPDAVLTAKAAERDMWFDQIVQDALANGVRAEGNDFDKDWWGDILKSQPMAKVKAQSEKWENAAEAVLNGGQGRLSRVPAGTASPYITNPDDYMV